jgi:hypothetical protein
LLNVPVHLVYMVPTVKVNYNFLILYLGIFFIFLWMTAYCLVGPFIYKKTHANTLHFNACIGGGGVWDVRHYSMHCWIKTKWLGDCNHVITLYSSKCYSITQWFADNNQLITLHSPKCWKKTKWWGNRSHLIRRLCKDIPPCLLPCFWKHFIFLSACISKCLFS